jgi:hypothetical protein
MVLSISTVVEAVQRVGTRIRMLFGAERRNNVTNIKSCAVMAIVSVKFCKLTRKYKKANQTTIFLSLCSTDASLSTIDVSRVDPSFTQDD